MVEAGDRELSREELLMVEDHLAQCPACTALKEFWQNIRAGLEKAPKAGIPAPLESRVRSLCHAEISALRAGQTQPDLSSKSAPVPWTIWAALAVLTGLTLALLVGGIEQFSRTREVTRGVLLLLILVLQNGLTLFFAPLVMRRQRLTNMHMGLIK
jgi:anti-sigma factor RsiW